MSAIAKAPPGPLTQEIVAIIKGAMGRGDVTRTRLAEATGISRPQVSKMLSGQKQIDVDELDRICFALGLNLTKIVRDAETVTASRHAEAGATARPVKG